jgi:hypothetical protein
MDFTKAMTKPLTKNMLETLIDCHERELMNLEPIDEYFALLCRVNSKRHLRNKIYITEKGKKIMACYVTNAGRRYLSNL